MKRAEKRQHLIEVASRLFNQDGFHGVGIDQIIAEAGIAKTTLYRHFESKEDLIVAVLRRIDARYRDDLRQFVERVPVSRRLMASFDFLEGWFEHKTFHGCPFVSAAAEYSDRRSPVFQEAVMHKRLLVAYFEELARVAGVEPAAEIAETINLLHEGAIAVAHVTGQARAAQRARTVAESLMAGGAPASS